MIGMKKGTLPFYAVFAIAAIFIIGLRYKTEIRTIYKKVQRLERVDASFKRAAISAYELHGIDVSHYQDRINWSVLKHPDTAKTIHFAFIRATAGLKTDSQFKRNWAAARKNNIVCGAYHYYHSDKNSALQAAHFIKMVTLEKGDLPPVLDIEELPKSQSQENWRMGLKNFLGLLEGHYGIKPIVYTGDAFYNDYLAIDPYFKSYNHLWIANYNMVEQPFADWDFWQYTDALPVIGTANPVDGNVYRGNVEAFNAMRIGF